jgi:hypothetical protein
MDDQTEVEEIIQRSGNSFHSKVVTALKTKGWSTLISPYYSDISSDKPREIDLLAEKVFPGNHNYGNSRTDVVVKLFIECKYIPQTTVFWFHSQDRIRARQLVTTTTPMRDNNGLTDDHHYLRSNQDVAKLFASESKRDAENEIMYKALNQSLNSLLYFRRGESGKSPMNGRVTIHYPVILCHNFAKFYRVNMESEAPATPVQDNFMLEVNYACLDENRKSKSEYFLIDVVEFAKLDELLKHVEEDVSRFRHLVG